MLLATFLSVGDTYRTRDGGDPRLSEVLGQGVYRLHSARNQMGMGNSDRLTATGRLERLNGETIRTLYLIYPPSLNKRPVDFPMGNFKNDSLIGDRIARTSGSLGKALRGAQERQMRLTGHMAPNAEKPRFGKPNLAPDIAQVRRIGI